VIIAEGNHLQHYLNDKLIHAGRPMWAEFKNIRIEHKPLVIGAVRT